MDALLRHEEEKPDSQKEKNEVLAELVEVRLKAADAEEIEEISKEMLAAPHEAPATLDESIENALPAAIFVANDRKQQASKKRSKKRNRNKRKMRREQEMTVRELVVKILKWGMDSGLSIAEIARHLYMSACTLGDWLKDFADGRPLAKEVGRKPEIADKKLRRELITLFGTMGPGVGIPTLQQYFPNTPRAELERLKEHYKYAYIKEGRMLIHALKWLKPGTVWAMDFTKFPTPLEGGMQFGLAVRDLSSRCCLELLVTDAEDSKTVIDLLSFLFALFGAPLVIKSDNGPPFASHETKNFLTRCGVFLLLSPPYTPSYNGAIESGFFPIKNFSLLEAARNDRPSAWTMDDVFSAKCRFNAVVRPDDPFGRTPQEIFNGRLGVTDQMRERFRECYLDLQKNACLELGYLLDYDDLSLQQQAEVDRIAIVKALVDQGHLEFRRRRITPVFSRRKCAGIVGG